MLEFITFFTEKEELYKDHDIFTPESLKVQIEITEKVL